MKLLTSHTFGLSLTAAALLVACGGSDPQAPTITRQPASLSVAEGAPAVFSVAAIGDDPLTYVWLDAANATAIPGATSDTFSIAAAALADDGKAVQVRVSNEVGSVTSQSATLSVAERTYSAAADVATDAAPRNLAAVADSNGHIHVLSVNGDATHADVRAHLKLRSADSSQANALLPAATLQASEVLSVASTSLRAAANGAGHVMAVWQRNGLVHAALYTPASDPATPGTWRPLSTPVSSVGAASALDPAVAAVGNTHFEIVWRERSGGVGPHDIKARRYAVASQQLDSGVATLEGSSDETGAPQVVADAAGNLIAAWDYSEGGVVFNRRAAGSAWTTSTTLAEGASGYRFETLKTNAAGQGVMLISNRLNFGGFVQLNLAASSPMVAVGSINAYGSAPDAHVFPDGRISVFGVAMHTQSGNATRLHHWQHVPQFGWGAPGDVSELSTDDFQATGLGVLNPQVIGADAAGNLVVAWEQRDSSTGGRGRIQTRRLHAGLDAWRAITTVGPTSSSSDHRQPLGAVAADGSATVVYRDVERDASAAVHLR